MRRPQQHDRRQDRKPQERNFRQCPVRPSQLEEQRAPENVQHAVGHEKPSDEQPTVAIL